MGNSEKNAGFGMRSLRWYNLIVSGVMVVCVLGGNLTALAYFAGYFLIEWMLVRGYE